MNIKSLEKLQCTFPKLTEINQFYILGLVEGLKHAQGTGNEKPMVKTLNNTRDVNSTFFNRSLE